jgi:hypothetical protein
LDGGQLTPGDGRPGKRHDPTLGIPACPRPDLPQVNLLEESEM